MQQTRSITIGTTLRAAAVTALAVTAAVVAWRLRPATTTTAASPDADIVLGCAWLAWALAGYLAVAIAATSLGRLAAGFGVAGASLARIAPPRLRRLVDATITLSLAATIAGTAAPAGATTGTGVVVSQSVTGSPLDWPGLAPTSDVAPQPHIGHHHHRAAGAGAGTVNGNHAITDQPSEVVVVQAGDTLWAIAARHLGPGASGASITAAWHAWYAANRAVIGANPSVIHPGQRLVAPPDTASTS